MEAGENRRGWFITGTDTGIGKTAVAEALLVALARRGYRAAGIKPVASGCRWTAEGLRSEDAERLCAASSVSVDYVDVNPYAFEPAVAPHVAATQVNVDIRLDAIQSAYERVAAQADWLVVEGAGGWYVPINCSRYISDIARAVALPVILVVGLRLGSINHGLLTASAIRADGLKLAGWIGNCVEPSFDTRDQTIAALRERLEAPCLGIIPHEVSGDTAVHGGNMLDRLLGSCV